MFQVGDKVKCLNELVNEKDPETGEILSAIPAGTIGTIVYIEQPPKESLVPWWYGYDVRFEGFGYNYPCKISELESVA